MDTPVYLDYAATAPLRPEARRALLEVLDGAWGNPSSVHRWGRESRAILDDARARLARLIGASPAEIVFTRAGTEADNLAVLGRARTLPGAPVVCSAVEHRAVLAAVRESGARAVILPANEHGVVRLEALDEALAVGPAVVSVMWANNETGVVQPVAEIAERCAAAGVAFHSDAVPALGRLSVRATACRPAMLSFSAHKVGGPKGIGALYVRRGTRVAPMVHGGGQERGLRPGTEDVAGALAFAAAAEAAEAERETSMRRLARLRDRLEAGLRERVPAIQVNGAARSGSRT
jgi:cysteine desulfurase